MIPDLVRSYGLKVLTVLKKRLQAFRLRAKVPRGKRVLRCGKVSKSPDSLTHLKVSRHALTPLVPLLPLVPLSVSWRSLRAQSIENLENLGNLEKLGKSTTNIYP